MCEETPCQRIAEISQGVGTVSGVRRSANHALPQMEMDRAGQAGQGWREYSAHCLLQLGCAEIGAFRMISVQLRRGSKGPRGSAHC